MVLRHQNAVLRRQVPRVRYERADRLWFVALSHLIPRRRWTEVFAITPATLLVQHRKLGSYFDLGTPNPDADPVTRK